MNGDFGSMRDSYVTDPRYAEDRIDLVRAYHLLEKDLYTIFDFVEPTDQNLSCYSHQLYALLLRASTEFETNARAVLKANGYSKPGSLNIEDYFKVNAASRLNEYEVTIPVWRGSYAKLKPLDAWSRGHRLPWYQSYNAAKHDRFGNFSSASLENSIQAVAGVFCILFSQFNYLSFDPNHSPSMYDISDSGVWSHDACKLAIEPPKSWTSADQYDFDWKILGSQSASFQKFPF
jgi:hypothetical protein